MAQAAKIAKSMSESHEPEPEPEPTSQRRAGHQPRQSTFRHVERQSTGKLLVLAGWESLLAKAAERSAARVRAEEEQGELLAEVQDALEQAKSVRSSYTPKLLNRLVLYAQREINDATALQPIMPYQFRLGGCHSIRRLAEETVYRRLSDDVSSWCRSWCRFNQSDTSLAHGDVLQLHLMLSSLHSSLPARVLELPFALDLSQLFHPFFLGECVMPLSLSLIQLRCLQLSVTVICLFCSLTTSVCGSQRMLIICLQRCLILLQNVARIVSAWRIGPL